jgi:DNA-binding GntR family transcriptional regulator
MPTHSADTIRESLEQSIVEREFKNGERLDEVRLAAKFGVSRTPLREALRMLAGSGLVELIQRRGAYVRYPGITELIEMFEVMAELEAFCVHQAARRASDEEVSAIEECARECEAKMDSDDYFHLNEDFHRLIYQASGNRFLATEARKLQIRLRPFRRMQLRTHGRMQQSMKEHAEIVKALKERDADRASEALRSHVSVQAERFHDLVAAYEKIN